MLFDSGFKYGRKNALAGVKIADFGPLTGCVTKYKITGEEIIYSRFSRIEYNLILSKKTI